MPLLMILPNLQMGGSPSAAPADETLMGGGMADANVLMGGSYLMSVIIVLAINTFILLFNTAFLLLMFFKREVKTPVLAEVREIPKRKKPMLADTGI